MDDAIRLVVVVVMGGVIIAAFVTVLDGYLPRLARRVEAMAVSAPWRSLLTGLANLLFFGVVALAFLVFSEWTGVTLLALPALAVLAVLAMAVVWGIVGMTGLLAGRAFGQHSRSGQMFRGSLLLFVACLTPVLGWFVLLPVVMLVGLGALILSFFQSSRLREESPDP